jgi:hypothetical protein
MGFRNVAYNTLASKVPEPTVRARFMSFQSAVQHLASALGAVLSSRLLFEDGSRRLVGVDRLAYVSIGLTAAVPFMLHAVERQVRARPAPMPAHDPQTGLRPMGPGVPRPADKG